jgi:hypothetical protein
MIALRHCCSATSVEVLCSFEASQVGTPLVKIFVPLSKSIWTWVVGTGTPLAALDVSFVVTSSAAGVKVFLPSFFGVIRAP